VAKKDEPAKTPAEPVVVSDADKERARQWFKKAADCRERREYDYAIECYITGLGYWPEAVEEGHMPLRSLAIQRLQAGGKKPGFTDGMRRPMTGKDARQAVFNAEHLLSMDPGNANYAEGLLRNAVKAGLLETAKWVTPVLGDALRKEKKPNKARFRVFRDLLTDAATLAEAQGQNALETWFLDQAVAAIEFVIVRLPGDDELRNEQRDLAGKLTISRGKYESGDDFRDSLRDADKQKLLHDADRTKQGDDTLDALISAAKAEWEAAPNVAARLNAYIDALLKDERRDHEDEAIAVLAQIYEQTRNYSFKLKADDVRLKQMNRDARAAEAKARASGSDDDRQQARLAALDLRQTLVETYRERIAQYPTDLRLKFKLGSALFAAGQFDEAIPVLQEARADPRSRSRAALMIGRSFLEKDNSPQAVEVLREAIDQYELNDDFSKELQYWLGRACEDAGRIDDAKAAYGRLLREDYNFMGGDARKRLESLSKSEPRS
jgi:hypothetical protein